MTALRYSAMLAVTVALMLAPMSAAADTTVKGTLLEQNHSGATGTATLTALSNGGLRVVIHSQGLVPNQPHAQHLHGSAEGGHFGCPTLKMNDKNHDGILTNEEAMGEYGTIFFALTTSGGVTPHDGLDVKRMPVADSKGRINYDRAFPAAMIPPGLREHLSALHVVQHGIDVNHNGKYDVAALGVSTFAERLGLHGIPEEATDPASCGVVTGAGAAEPARHGAETGGAPPLGANGPTAAVGGALLLLSAAVARPWRRRRRSPVRSDDS
ncbi:hypothetical protein GCM10009841_19940 [Microlunatus panaciterrae]|uniref:CHRD domain-containing protein n=1 Tax=Microlunatus panaciterrae TaxID=400768 RepID=A0ABS2RPP4_9ACTN|nr:hypothetical protein [Microlunatus panaciterrae]MBM7800547.1 hypothetical protein [Microlunatus panaciterrae]